MQATTAREHKIEFRYESLTTKTTVYSSTYASIMFLPPLSFMVQIDSLFTESHLRLFICILCEKRKKTKLLFRRLWGIYHNLTEYYNSYL